MVGGPRPGIRINMEEETDSLLEKASEKARERETSLGRRDTWWSLSLRDIDTAPGQYDLFPLPVPTFASKQFMFRSAVQRFPTIYFTPKEGPGPGDYEMKGKPPHPVSSCFQSKIPRLQPIRSKIPGPGTYEPTRQFPKQPRTIASLGHEHSIFFSNTFGF
nr:protein STPG4 isoform X4 [Pelodiscus sinensis]|eukprot:XP_025041644.1 protein STPG4 isoform X4 [Pelodiscus sinensis]